MFKVFFFYSIKVKSSEKIPGHGNFFDSGDSRVQPGSFQYDISEKEEQSKEFEDEDLTTNNSNSIFFIIKKIAAKNQMMKSQYLTKDEAEACINK